MEIQNHRMHGSSRLKSGQQRGARGVWKNIKSR